MLGYSTNLIGLSALCASLGFLLLDRRRLRWLLKTTPPNPSSALLSEIKTVVFDCDGVLYRNASPVPGVREALTSLRKSSKRLIFVTNAAGQSRASLAKKLTKLGFEDVRPEDCITSAFAAAAYLTKHYPLVKRAYIVGGGGLFEELRLAGIECVGEADIGGLEWLVKSGGLNDDVDAVVVGMQTEDLCYARLAKAAAYVREDPSRPFIGANPDNSYPGGLTTLIPAGGCLVRYVEYAAERPATAIVGKPSRDLALLVQQLYGLRPDTTLMVGDRCNTDIAFGHSVGWRTLLVLTGCHDLADVNKAPYQEKPDFMASSVADLAGCL